MLRTAVDNQNLNAVEKFDADMLEEKGHHDKLWAEVKAYTDAAGNNPYHELYSRFRDPYAEVAFFERRSGTYF